MTASRIFKKSFSERNLLKVYKEKIKDSGAIGIDRVRPSKLDLTIKNEIKFISKKVHSGNYKFTAYKEKLISKGANSNPRQISIPTARDRITLRALCECLTEIYPDSKLRLPHKVIDSLKVALNSGLYTEYAKIDLRTFYPSIEHTLIADVIKNKIRKSEIRKLIMSSLVVPTVSEFKGSKGVSENARGVPQGLAISNILAEISLSIFDKEINENTDIWFMRYVDDILILTPNGKAETMASHVIEKLQLLNLHPHPLNELSSKSKVGTLDETFDFLGYHISQGELLIKHESILRFESSLAKIFTAYRHAIQQAKNKRDKERAIAYCQWKLNLRITGCVFEGKRLGWVSYFSQISTTAQLRSVNHTVSHLIRRFSLSSDIKQKSLIKTFYELRRGTAETFKYIPNFDNLDVSQKRELVSMWIGKDKAKILSNSEIEKKFKFKIAKSAKELEEDISGIS
ncbi:TPA: reverse transcriptase domain-containing protein [Klebsiella pneumoniae]|uniref:reverse transcriptase domain-containing protein n=1 Tax=Klebsiella michiganensis TaxID=1134687 RepID=UPI0015A5D35E|nr:reverse transcriptase domain-containing protein [Klebsiella michiganensis]HBS6426774.1 reverse transcriptase [Klebsiella pneumoniae]HBT3584118.1 reverse transcriptase [Klebsiella pneumoniae]HDK6063798.1 reverse transcriptase [Klebsiella pneumoniae]